MAKWDKFRAALSSGRSDNNIRFNDLCGYLRHLGFNERTEGSHHIFDRDDIPEIINLQPQQDGKAKNFQVKQVRNIILQYGL